MAASSLGYMFLIFEMSGAYAQYYMPLLLFFSIWTGFSVFLIITLGEAVLENNILRHLGVMLTGTIFFAVLALGVSQKWDFVNHRDDLGMRIYLNTVLSEARPGAVILANWDSYTGIMYAQKVNGLRPDIRLISVAPESWRDILPQVRDEYPGSQILLSATLTYDEDADVSELTGPYPLSVKGRTYQDFMHGEPFPAAVKLYEVR